MHLQLVADELHDNWAISLDVISALRLFRLLRLLQFVQVSSRLPPLAFGTIMSQDQTLPKLSEETQLLPRWQLVHESWFSPQSGLVITSVRWGLFCLLGSLSWHSAGQLQAMASGSGDI